MVIMAMHQTPSLTRERYEEVIRRLTGRSRAESLADLPFPGLLVHAAGEGPDGFVIFDVFESRESVDRFRDAVTPIAREAGIEVPPEFFTAHTFVAADRA